jgi:hypothetical protein
MKNIQIVGINVVALEEILQNLFFLLNLIILDLLSERSRSLHPNREVK